MEEKIVQNIDKLIDSISSKINDSSQSVFSIEHDLDWCVGNIICSLLVGKTYPQSNDTLLYKFKNSINVTSKHLATFKIALLNSFPILRFIPLFENFGYKVFTKYAQLALKEIKLEVESHKSDLKLSDEVTDFTAAYLTGTEIRTKICKGVLYHYLLYVSSLYRIKQKATIGKHKLF